MSTIKTALTIGGSDPSGCGGIQGDLKVFSSYGLFGTSVITAITCQNSSVVKEVVEMPASLVERQFYSIYDDITINSLKIGMLASSENVNIASKIISELSLKNVVLDPVILSSKGTPLLESKAINIMIDLLLPLVDIVTPNLDEAGELAGIKVDGIDGMQEAATNIKKLGPSYVLVKGGHLKGRAIDILYDGKKMEFFDSPRIEGPDFRGTGCALSAAITASLAKGDSIPKSVKESKGFISQAISKGFPNLGKGMGILNHNIERSKHLEAQSE